MPDPLTPSDRDCLTRIAKVIDMAHEEFEMRVSIVLCPNVSPKSEEGRKYTFEQETIFFILMIVLIRATLWHSKTDGMERKNCLHLFVKLMGYLLLTVIRVAILILLKWNLCYLLGAHRRMLGPFTLARYRN